MLQSTWYLVFRSLSWQITTPWLATVSRENDRVHLELYTRSLAWEHHGYNHKKVPVCGLKGSLNNFDSTRWLNSKTHNMIQSLCVTDLFPPVFLEAEEERICAGIIHVHSIWPWTLVTPTYTFFAFASNHIINNCHVLNWVSCIDCDLYNDSRITAFGTYT